MKPKLGARLLLVSLGFLAGCGGLAATAPPAPRAGTATLWGTVRLVPHQGVTLPASAGAYADRALRDAELVDYSKPEFAVVSVEGLPSPGGTATLVLRASRFATRFEPRYAAVGVGGTVTVRNEDAIPHLVSSPRAGALVSVLPGGSAEIPAREPGEQRVFEVSAPAGGGASGAEASVYVASGPFAVASSDGRWVLAELPVPVKSEPGGAAAPLVLHAWHPRFPPIDQPLSLAANDSRRLDLEFQVR